MNKTVYEMKIIANTWVLFFILCDRTVKTSRDKDTLDGSWKVRMPRYGSDFGCHRPGRDVEFIYENEASDMIQYRLLPVCSIWVS